jgi:MFS family permease
VWRILGVTALVSILGGLVGALAAAAVAAIVVSLPSVTWFGSLINLLLGAMLLGFVVGGFVSPLMTWAFMRRVPLWRASMETAFASMLGLVLGPALHVGFIGTIGTSLLCAILAALRLKRAYRLPSSEPEAV